MTSIYITALIMGLLGSVHCIGMCGAIVGVLSANLDESVRSNPIKLVWYQLSYNIGRILMYVVMGVFFASFSYLLAHSIGISTMELILRVVAGIMLILIGLFIAGVTSYIVIFERIGKRLWQYLSKYSTHFLPVKHPRQALFFGLFWGGIPCGLVYSALALTLTASPVEGALIMAFFGLGTLPTLLAIAGFGFGLLRFLSNTAVKKVAGASIVLLGVWSLIMPITHLMNDTVHTQHSSSHSLSYMHH